MANEIIRDELKERKVYQWELAHELDISEQTMVRRMHFEMNEEEQWKYIALIDKIALRKEHAI